MADDAQQPGEEVPTPTFREWGMKKLDLMFTQVPALGMALVLIAVGLGWINSPVLEAAQQMVADHNKLLSYSRAICLNVADMIVDPKLHEGAMRRCD